MVSESEGNNLFTDPGVHFPSMNSMHRSQENVTRPLSLHVYVPSPTIPLAWARPAYPPCPNLIRASPKAMSMVIFRPKSIPFAEIIFFSASPITEWNGGSRSFFGAASRVSRGSRTSPFSEGFFVLFGLRRRRPPPPPPFFSLCSPPFSAPAPAFSLALSPVSAFLFTSFASFLGGRFRSRVGGLIAAPPGLVTFIAFNFPLSSFSISNSTSDPSTLNRMAEIKVQKSYENRKNRVCH